MRSKRKLYSILLQKQQQLEQINSPKKIPVSYSIYSLISNNHITDKEEDFLSIDIHHKALKYKLEGYDLISKIIEKL